MDEHPSLYMKQNIFTVRNIILLLFIPLGILFYKMYTIHGLFAVFISVQMHEFGHYLGLKQANLTITKLQYNITHLYFEVEEDSLSIKNELLVSGSGPMAGLFSVVLLSPYIFTVLESTTAILLILIIITIHSFNLLPIEGYDGYYIKKAITNS